MGWMQTSTRFPFNKPGQAEPVLESRVDELCSRLSLLPPNLLAERTGAAYLELGQGRGEFHFGLFDAPVVLTYPDFSAVFPSGEHVTAFKRALLIYYFVTSDGTPPSGEWISFADLPDGRIYASAFQGYSGNELAKAFALDLAAFQKSCEKLGGALSPFGEASYRFRALPRLDLLAVYHLGDEDFPSSCNILFDSTVGHYLPTEACAIIGSMLTRKILWHHRPSA